MTGQFLKPEELLCSSKKSEDTFIKFGNKEIAINSCNLQTQNLIEFYQQRLQFINQECVKKRNKLAEGEWLENEKLVQLSKIVGKFWQIMGFRIKGRNFLYPEEAMYLIQKGQLLVYNSGLMISSEEAYFTLFDACEIHKYQLFSYLSTYGYIINHNHIFEQKNKPIFNKIKNCMVMSKTSHAPNIHNGIIIKPLYKNFKNEDLDLFKKMDINTFINHYLQMNSCHYEKCKIPDTNYFKNDDYFNENLLNNHIFSKFNLASVFVILHKPSIRRITIKPFSDNSLLPPNVKFSKSKYVYDFVFNSKDEYNEICLSLKDIICNTDVEAGNNINFELDAIPNCSINAYSLPQMSNFTYNIDKQSFLMMMKFIGDPSFLIKLKDRMLNSKQELPSPLVNPVLSLDSVYEKLNIISNSKKTNKSQPNCDTSKTMIDYLLYYPNKKFKKTNPGQPALKVLAQKFSDKPPQYKNLKYLKQIRNFEANVNSTNNTQHKNLENQSTKSETIDCLETVKFDQNNHIPLIVAPIDDAQGNFYEFNECTIPYCH